MKSQKWEVSDMENSSSLGEIEFKDNSGEFHNFTLLYTGNTSKTPGRIVFGGICNAGFIESGYIEYDDLQEGLENVVTDLENYYNFGPESVEFIVFNERM